MSKVDLIRYKAIDRGWTKKDVTRVYNKIKELSTQFEGGTILFNTVEDLAMMLDENIDYKLEYSLCRLSQEGKIFLGRLRSSDCYTVEVATF